jgi:hypothetical protein
MTIAILTVFIAKENILYLLEWIAYHIIKGVDKFYLYDNTGVEKMTGWDKSHAGGQNGMIPNKINKYGFNYSNSIKMTDEEVTQILKLIKLQFKPGVVNFIKWQPKDKNGNITYNQEGARKNFMKNFKDNIDWMVYIDIDEFIVSKLSIPKLVTKLDL